MLLINVSLLALVITGSFQHPTYHTFFSTWCLWRSVTKEVACEGSPPDRNAQKYGTLQILKNNRNGPLLFSGQNVDGISQQASQPSADTSSESIQVVFCKVDGQNRREVCGPITKSACENMPPTFPTRFQSRIPTCAEILHSAAPHLSWSEHDLRYSKPWVPGPEPPPLLGRREETQLLLIGPLISLFMFRNYNRVVIRRLLHILIIETCRNHTRVTPATCDSLMTEC